ncbi:hypothetical protein Ndes2526B_g08164 [Nannochloris sp. 'desiccata']
MDVNVLFFARSRELAGVGDALLQLSAGADTASFIEELYRKYPSLEEIRGAFALAVNQEYLPAGEVATIKAGDEIAIIPPISGG